MSHSSAPAKLILCGEHAVVYGRPAIALPLASLRARAEIGPGEPGGGITFAAPDLGRSWRAAEAPDDPLSALALATLAHLGVATPDITLSIRSDIPIASGMGSGAAVGTAVVRALAALAGRELPAAQISALVYESERRLHGTPSGIDNTVVAFEQPIWFQRAIRQQSSAASPIGANASPQSSSFLPIAAPFTLVIGDTGVRSPTRGPVGALRQRRQEQPARYEALFDQVGEIVAGARAALASGDTAALGPLLSANHELLGALGVSSPELDRLVRAALAAGSLGAKLSGAGWGGVMLALAPDAEATPAIAAALTGAGAARVLTTSVEPSAPTSPRPPAAGRNLA
jgi:mevalonate kinase